MVSSPPSPSEPLKLLGDLGTIGSVLQRDVELLSAETTHQVNAFLAGYIDLPEVCFWHKGLVRSFFTLADGLSFAIRQAALDHADEFGVTFSKKALSKLDPHKHIPLEEAVPHALRSLARLYSAAAAIDTSNEDFRGFKALTDAREQFTHPKSHVDVCPFTIFPTSSPAMEWFFVSWRDTLLSCAEALGHNLRSKLPPRRFQFRDELLARFAEKRAEWDARRTPGFVSDLADVVFPLMQDTRRAMDVLLGKGTRTQVPADCAARNLLATLFAEIEGTILVTASLLRRYGHPTEPDVILLVGDHGTVCSNIARLAEQFSRAFGTNQTISRESTSSKIFPRARNLRNRLTHPKSPDDLLLPPDTIDLLLELGNWWHLDVHRCFELGPNKIPAQP